MKNKKFITIIVLLIIALISFFILAPLLSDTNLHAGSIDYLSNKSETVLALAASSTSASALISALPDDMGTPIATQLCSFNIYFIILLCAIYLEKYLVTITALATFKIIIPVSCAIGMACLFLHSDSIKRLAIKLAIFGILIFAVVPTSVQISKVIEETYQVNIQETINGANNFVEENKVEEEKGFFDQVKDKVTEFTAGITNMVDKAKTTVNNFIESIAVLLITSCLIPILVFLSFIWIAKWILGINTENVKLSKLSAKNIKNKYNEYIND